MDYLKLKSEQNKRAAEYFCSTQGQPLGCWAPAIHSSYYACLLLILQKLFSKYYTKEEFLKNQNSLKKASHETAIYLAELEIAKKVSTHPKEFNEYNEFIGELKGIRVSADYFNENADLNLARKALDLHNKLAGIINKLL